MTHDAQIQLIKRLKQQPRHGQTGPIQQVEAALLSLYKNYKESGDDIVKLNVFGKISEQILSTVKSLTVLEQANSGLAETFNMNQVAAADWGAAIEKAAKNSGVPMQKAKEYAQALKDEFLGLKTAYTDQGRMGNRLIKNNNTYLNLLGQTATEYRAMLQTQFGFADGSAQAFDNFEYQLAGVAEKFEKLGYAGAFSDIVGGFEALSDQTKLVFGQMPKNIGLAIYKAKSLGIELDAILGASEGFLDVNEAITRQTELQVIGRKNLRTEQDESMSDAIVQARLQGDANRLVELYAQTVSAYSEEIKKNPYVMESVANYLQISKDQVSAIYLGMSKTKALTGDQNNLLAAGADHINATAATYNKIVEAESEITTEQVAQQKLADKQLDILQVTGEKIQAQQDLLIKPTAPGGPDQLDKVIDLSAKATAGFVNIAEPLIGIASTLFNVAGFASDLLPMVTTDLGSTLTTAEGGQSIPLGTTPQKDVFIPAANGTVVSGPFGSFALDPKDDVLAMPGIREATRPQGGMNTDAMASVVSNAIQTALKGMSFHVTNNFDGKKIKSALMILDQSSLNNINAT